LDKETLETNIMALKTIYKLPKMNIFLMEKKKIPHFRNSSKI